MRDSSEEERLRKLEAFLSTGNAFRRVQLPGQEECGFRRPVFEDALHDLHCTLPPWLSHNLPSFG